ncbi:hypothetical protein Tco_0680990 [Tanacetum coccineum]|uniref:Uncharacterized protein n=1 Tax=Tanacetum coccineum TaxID=301880 RepID=A0ABQ4XN02_9ASTR
MNDGDLGSAGGGVRHVEGATVCHRVGGDDDDGVGCGGGGGVHRLKMVADVRRWQRGWHLIEMVVRRLLCGGMMMMVVMGCGCRRGGGEKWRVAASGEMDQIDPEMRSISGFGQKSPPEKFSGGGEWPAVGVVAG